MAISASAARIVAVGAIDRREVTFAEQQRNAVLHHDAAQRIAHAGSAVAQRDIFTARTTLFVELVRQDIVQLAVQHTLQDIQRPRARRIVRIARNQVADRLEHGIAELDVVRLARQERQRRYDAPAPLPRSAS